MLLITEYCFFLLPALAIALWSRLPLKETFALKAPPWRGVLSAILIGAFGWTLAAGVLVRLLPPPESLARALEKIVLLDGAPVPLWVIFLVIGVTPGICEELFFRGLVMSGFRRMGFWPAVFVTALLFGVAHSSIYRLLPTLWLGLLFGIVVWRTGSVWCGVIAHAINNGLMAAIAQKPELVDWLGLKGAVALPWLHTAAGAVVIALALWLLPRETKTSLGTVRAENANATAIG